MYLILFIMFMDLLTFSFELDKIYYQTVFFFDYIVAAVSKIFYKALRIT